MTCSHRTPVWRHLVYERHEVIHAQQSQLCLSAWRCLLTVRRQEDRSRRDPFTELTDTSLFLRGCLGAPGVERTPKERVGISHTETPERWGRLLKGNKGSQAQRAYGPEKTEGDRAWERWSWLHPIGSHPPTRQEAQLPLSLSF